jgi:DNA-nicking Smr family endonuclease
MGDRFLTEEEKKLWETVNKETKPLKKPNQKIIPSSPKEKKSYQKISLSPEIFPMTNHLPVDTTKDELTTLDRKTKRKIHTSSIRIERRLDLHGKTQDQAYDCLVSFIEKAAHSHCKLVLIITGKGINKGEFLSGESRGVLRQRVPQWLLNKRAFPFVQSVSVANPKDGGEGALYVFLKS